LADFIIAQGAKIHEAAAALKLKTQLGINQNCELKFVQNRVRLFLKSSTQEDEKSTTLLLVQILVEFKAEERLPVCERTSLNLVDYLSRDFSNMSLAISRIHVSKTPSA